MGSEREKRERGVWAVRERKEKEGDIHLGSEREKRERGACGQWERWPET